MTRFNVSGLEWTFHFKTNPEWLGMLPLIILDTDMRPVREQVAERYRHGGGWNPFTKFKIQVGMDNRYVLVYPGDPPLRMLCECHHPNGEHVCLFEGSWLMVVQKDGKHEISRID